MTAKKKTVKAPEQDSVDITKTGIHLAGAVARKWGGVLVLGLLALAAVAIFFWGIPLAAPAVEAVKKAIDAGPNIEHKVDQLQGSVSETKAQLAALNKKVDTLTESVDGMGEVLMQQHAQAPSDRLLALDTTAQAAP